MNTEIKSQYPESKGELIFLKVDLEDLNSVKVAAHEFLSKESCLHVLWHNAAVLLPPRGSKTKQDWDLQLGVNCLAPFLFTKLLTPALISAAKTAPEGSVRVMFVSSSAAYLFAPPGGVEMVKLKDKDLQYDPVYMYGVSKAGVALYALGFAQRYQDDGIIAVVRLPSSMLAISGDNLVCYSRVVIQATLTRICLDMYRGGVESSCGRCNTLLSTEPIPNYMEDCLLISRSSIREPG